MSDAERIEDLSDLPDEDLDRMRAIRDEARRKNELLVGRGGRALGRARAAKKAALCAAMPLHELRQAREMTQKALASL